jgi:hypothetical protein
MRWKRDLRVMVVKLRHFQVQSYAIQTVQESELVVLFFAIALIASINDYLGMQHTKQQFFVCFRILCCDKRQNF